MISKKIIVKNKLGLHARPASNFVKEASKYKSDIHILKGEKTYNAKSLINLLSACIKCNTEIEIRCNGIDENDAIEALFSMIEAGLGEE